MNFIHVSVLFVDIFKVFHIQRYGEYATYFYFVLDYSYYWYYNMEQYISTNFFSQGIVASVFKQ